ncbi:MULTISPECIES: M15 family metallopeptidase [Paenibacillus]|uniref:M15 family metallopeptidase n=1 Tax=Paenibacillus TaxID=44249 RepID=UPI0002073045|nr:M15 family metallopeptidase [Paenibacillus sp. HGF5]EGG36397.1 putative peptidoglycan L-alanyl-D-glutamate endopeptidase CwlK [Paenibacillus sp. HGF5]
MIKRKKTTLFLVVALLLAIFYMQLQTAIPGFINDLDFDFNSKETPEITQLHPYVLQQKNELVRLTKKKGITIVITDGYRSHEEQTRIYNQGRSTEGNIVTNAKAGESLHNYGLAIDFALRLKDGSVIWDMEYDGNGNGKADWMEVVEIAKDLGFQWGGDWANFPDYPHLQIDFGLSIRDLKRGKLPPMDASEYSEAK